MLWREQTHYAFGVKEIKKLQTPNQKTTYFMKSGGDLRPQYNH